MRCTKCRGVGKFFPPEGITKNDMKPCHLCNGSGTLPDSYMPKKDTKKNRAGRYFRKSDGLENVEKVDAE